MMPKKTTADSEGRANQKIKLAPLSHAVGRRKRASARVWMRRGSGKILVNGLDYAVYFDTDFMRGIVAMPFKAVAVAENYDYQVIVHGGGKVGQAQAVKLAIARTLLKSDEAFRASLRQYRLLTVDSRITERKKYGQKGARRKFQFVKR